MRSETKNTNGNVTFAEQIMTEVANEHSYETWGEIMFDTRGQYQLDCTTEAMRLAAIRFMEWSKENGRRANSSEELFEIWNNEK